VDRSSPAAIAENANALVESIAKEVAYSAIPDNGCPDLGTYVTVRLVAPFDGFDQDARVILRLQALMLGPTTVGATLAYTDLRRMGHTADGTFVYCGRGQVARARKTE
jgi:hypothetical protein